MWNEYIIGIGLLMEMILLPKELLQRSNCRWGRMKSHWLSMMDLLIRSRIGYRLQYIIPSLLPTQILVKLSMHG